MVVVTKRTAQISGFLATMTVMTLMTVNCGCFLRRGGSSPQLRRPLPLLENLTNPTPEAENPTTMRFLGPKSASMHELGLQGGDEALLH
jgi:hypothetical protein